MALSRTLVEAALSFGVGECRVTRGNLLADRALQDCGLRFAQPRLDTLLRIGARDLIPNVKGESENGLHLDASSIIRGTLELPFHHLLAGGIAQSRIAGIEFINLANMAAAVQANVKAQGSFTVPTMPRGPHDVGSAGNKAAQRFFRGSNGLQGSVGLLNGEHGLVGDRKRTRLN